MEWIIFWEKDGIVRETLCISTESIALKYAIMLESQGYKVTITEREWASKK